MSSSDGGASPYSRLRRSEIDINVRIGAPGTPSLRGGALQDSTCDAVVPGDTLDWVIPCLTTMPPKLSSRQQAQLAYLELMPPKLQRIYSVVEQLANPRVDEALIRGLGRLVDDIKGNAASLSMASLAETAGRMGMLIRSGGGLPTKVRGLRELQGSLKINYDAALRSATTPEEPGGEEPF